MKTKYITEIEIHDPETGSTTTVEIHKDMESGALIGIDSSFLERVSHIINSPFNDSKLECEEP